MSKRTKRKSKRRAVRGGSHIAYLWGVELHGEPLDLHGPEVAKLQYEAVEAIHRGEVAKAEQLLQQALALEPRAPDLWNNLAAAYEMQGRGAEAEALVRRIHREHPGYLFGRTNLAHVCVREGDVDRARRLIEPLFERTRFHFSEFAALCAAQIDVALAEGKFEAAQAWLDFWQEATPQHPGLAQWRPRVRGFRAALGRWARDVLRGVKTG